MLLRKALERRASLENPRTNLSSVNWPGDGLRTAAGANINEHTALTIAAVSAAIRIASEAVASLPIMVYERLARGRDRATGSAMWKLLHDRPNREMSPFSFKETLQAHIESWGNAYAEIERNNAGTVIGLWPLMPDRTFPERVNGQKRYKTRLPNGQQVVLPGDRVLHIPGPGDGFVGRPPITMWRESLGLTKAAEEYGARWFGNGARPGGVLTHPGIISPKARTNMKESWQEMHGGLENSHRVAILEEGVKFDTIGLPPEDSQFLETRRFQVQEVARWFRIPLHMLADSSMAPAANVEATSLDFLTYSLTPRLVRWEQALNWDIVPQGQLFAEFEVKALLRGDNRSRAEYLRTMFNIGAMSANEIRETDNLGNPVDGGDEYMVPLNMVPLSQVGQEPEPATKTDPVEPEPDPTRMRARLTRQFRPLLEDAVSRGLMREIKAATEARKKGVVAFRKWRLAFYDTHRNHLIRFLTPAISAYADAASDFLVHDQSPDAAVREFVTRWTLESERMFDVALDAADPMAALDDCLRQWAADRATTLTQTAVTFAADRFVTPALKAAA